MWLRCANHSFRPVMKVFQPPFVALLVSMLSVFTSTSQLFAAPKAMPVVALANITSFPCIIISLCIYVIAANKSTAASIAEELTAYSVIHIANAFNSYWDVVS
jgi:hypothetical protein